MNRRKCADPVERFWSKVRVGGPDECWEWTTCLSQGGYGKFSVREVKLPAHRFSAMLHFGMFDRRLWVLHHCDNRKCVNPRHLYLGDYYDNLNDAVSRGRMRNQYVGRTACSRGHDYVDGSFRIVSAGERLCLICQQMRIDNVKQNRPEEIERRRRYWREYNARRRGKVGE